MKRLSIFVVLALGLCLPFALRAADEKKMTVVDLFSVAADKTLETPPRAWLGNAQVIDRQNGYISIAGDGAQLSFQVALFRYRDLAGRDSSRFCSGELEGTIRSPWTFSSSERTARCTKHLEEFFRSATGGVLANTNQNMKTCNLSCATRPHDSRRSHKSGKVLHKFTWTVKSLSSSVTLHPINK